MRDASEKTRFCQILNEESALWKDQRSSSYPKAAVNKALCRKLFCLLLQKAQQQPYTEEQVRMQDDNWNLCSRIERYASTTEQVPASGGTP